MGSRVPRNAVRLLPSSQLREVPSPTPKDSDVGPPALVPFRVSEVNRVTWV